ncbi:MAG: hypothetical protein WCP35_05670 [Verrucomicrobiota bacterium]
MKLVNFCLILSVVCALSLVFLSACKSSKSVQESERTADIADLVARLDEVERQVGILHNEVEYLKTKTSAENSGFEVKRLKTKD